jgi:DNA adenine methylase
VGAGLRSRVVSGCWHVKSLVRLTGRPQIRTGVSTPSQTRKISSEAFFPKRGALTIGRRTTSRSLCATPRLGSPVDFVETRGTRVSQGRTRHHSAKSALDATAVCAHRLISKVQGMLFEARGSELLPPLKWAGGKRWLVPRLREIYDEHRDRRLVEPFVGGMSVLLGLRPRESLLNDANRHLIEFYRWLQTGLTVDLPLRNERQFFQSARSRFNDITREGNSTSSEASQLFYYLNRTAFNGLCRFNSSGMFNVPFGSYKRIHYRADFLEYTAALRDYTFQCGDFDEIRLNDMDFIYADPPYDVDFTSYSAGGFSWNDQVRLAEFLAQHKGPVVASNQATKRVLHLYRSCGFTVETLAAPRRISCNGDRSPALEMLAIRGL